MEQVVKLMLSDADLEFTQPIFLVLIGLLRLDFVWFDLRFKAESQKASP